MHLKNSTATLSIADEQSKTKLRTMPTQTKGRSINNVPAIVAEIMKEELEKEKGIIPKPCNCNMRSLMKHFIRWVEELDQVKWPIEECDPE